RRDRRHASADAPNLREQGSRPSEAHARRHAALLGARPRAAARDPAPDDRARAQPGRRGARPAAAGRGAADARAACPHGAGDAPRRRRGAQDLQAGAGALPAPDGTRTEKELNCMDFNKLTIQSQEAVAAAQELARRDGNPELYPEHLLLALLDQELPRQLVPDPDALRAAAEARLAQKPRIQGGQQQPQVSAAFSKVRDRAADKAKPMEDDYVTTEA